MITTPRLRKDLRAQPIEEEGVLYVDVSDPQGGSMRLYDFEWQIAERMDGAATLDEVAAWARARFGWTATGDDLAAYAARLQELGFVHSLEEPAEPAPAIPAAAQVAPVEPVAPPSMSPALESAPAPAAAAAAGATLEIEAADQCEATARPFTPHLDPTTPMMAAVAAAVAETELPPVERPPALDRPPSLLDATPSFSPPSPSFTPAPPPAFAPAPSTMQLEPPPSPGFATQPAFEPPPVRMDVPLTAPVKPIPSEKPRSSGLIWFLLLVLVGAVLFLVYTFVVEPALRPVHVQVLPAPAAHEVVQSFPGRGTALRAEAKALNFGEAGKIADIVAAGTELKEGMTIATLDGYAAVERELTDVRDREKYYAEQLKAAQAKGNAAAVKQAEGKANEKKKRIVELEERAKRVRLVAPGVATVTEALVKAGDAVKAGDPIAKVADQRLMAQFKLPPGESANLRAGRQVQVAPEGGSALAAAKVMAVDQDTVRVDLLDNAGGAIKVDTPVVLVKSKVADAVSLPPIAVSRNASGGDQVFVFADGVVRARPVTVIDRTPKVVVLGPGGLQPGEQVVISPTDQLTDGQRASISE